MADLSQLIDYTGSLGISTSKRTSSQKILDILEALNRKRQEHEFEYPSGYKSLTDQWYFPLLSKDVRRKISTIGSLVGTNPTHLDQLAKQAYNLRTRIGEQGLPTSPQASLWQKGMDLGKKTMTGVMSALMAFPRAGSAFSTELARSMKSIGDYQERFKQLPRSILQSAWEGLKALPNLSEKYKNWSYKDFFKELGIPDKPFAWAKDTDDWAKGLNWFQKIASALVGTPAATAGFVGDIALDPLTYLTLGVGHGAKAIKLPVDILKKLGPQATRTGKIFLKPAGISQLSSLYDDMLKLIGKSRVGKEFVQEAGIKGLGQLKKVSAGTPITGLLSKAQKEVAEQLGQEALEKLAYQSAVNTFGRRLGSMAAKDLSRLIDYGGLKVFGHTILKPETISKIYQKTGLAKVADFISNTKPGQVARQVKNSINSWRKKVFTMKGEAPEELYQLFRYHMDLMANYEKKQAMKMLAKIGKGYTKESRKRVTEYLCKPYVLDVIPEETLRKVPIRKMIRKKIIETVPMKEADKARLIKLQNYIDELDNYFMGKINDVLKGVEGIPGVENPLKVIKEFIKKHGGLAYDPVNFEMSFKDPANKALFPLIGSRERSAAGIRGTATVDQWFQELWETHPQHLRALGLIPGDYAHKFLDVLKQPSSKFDVKGFSRELMTEEDYLDLVSNIIRKSPDDIEKLEKLMKAEEVASIAAARLAEFGDPLTRLTTHRSMLMNLIPDQISDRTLKIAKHYQIPGQASKQVERVIEEQVTEYVDQIFKIKKWIKKPKELTPDEKFLVKFARENLEKLYEYDHAWGVGSKYRRGYVPGFTEEGARLPILTSKKAKEIGSAAARYQQPKVFPHPLAARQAGFPAEMDIIQILYKRNAESINKIARKKFLTQATKFGRKGVPVSQRTKYVKITEIPELKGMYFKPQEAQFLNRAKDFLSDEGTNSVLKLYDQFTGWGKTFATAPIPGFHFRNMYSNWWQLYLMEGAQGLNPAWHKKAVDILRGVGGKKIKLAGKTYTYEQLLELSQKWAITGTGWMGSETPTALSRQLAEAVMPKGEKVLRGMKLFSREGAPAKYGTIGGRFIEDEARLTGFLIELNKHGDASHAAGVVKKFMFDYSELSNAEKTLFKRIMPFYTWARKNIPLEFEQLVKQPGKFAAIPKLKTLVEASTPIPEGYEQYKPDYFEELYAIATPLRDSEGNMLVFNPNFAWQDISRVSVKDFFSMLNPLISVPFELATNHEIFYGKEIEQYDGELVEAPGYLAPLLALPAEWLKKFGLTKGVRRKYNPETGRVEDTGEEMLYIPARAEYISRQIPFLHNIAKSLPQERRPTTATHLGSWLTGIKFFPYEGEKSRYFKTAEDIENLKALVEKYKQMGLWSDEGEKSKVIKAIQDIENLQALADKYKQISVRG